MNRIETILQEKGSKRFALMNDLLTQLGILTKDQFGFKQSLDMRDPISQALYRNEPASVIQDLILKRVLYPKKALEIIVPKT